MDIQLVLYIVSCFIVITKPSLTAYRPAARFRKPYLEVAGGSVSELDSCMAGGVVYGVVNTLSEAYCWRRRVIKVKTMEEKGGDSE